MHDLGNLLDGSMRQVNLALRSLDDAWERRNDQTDLDRRLRIVKTALEQMAGMLASATRPSGEGQAPDRLPGMSLGDAVRHAASILEPEASDHGVRFEVRVDPRLDELPAQTAYCVVVNAARNALDAMKAKGSGGTVRITGAIVKGPWSEEAAIEVADEGVGLRDAEAGLRAFEPGYSTKQGRLGLGLALCREVVNELGGTASLKPGEGNAGAVFSARWPLGKNGEGR